MEEKTKLGVKDMKILTELDKNARQSNNQIGKKVRLSKEVVKYRIDKMFGRYTLHAKYIVSLPSNY